MPALPDLTTLAFIQASLPNLTTAQIGVLPTLLTAASRLIRKWTNRKLTRAIWDELYQADPGGMLILREYPINAVRVRSNAVTVLTIQQTDSTINQDAWVSFNYTGNQDTGQVLTGITLSRLASGVQTDAPLLFSGNTTFTALATAINVIGNGWTAIADSQFGKWATADLKMYQGALSAMGGCSLMVHSQTVPCTYEADAGIVFLGGQGSFDPTYSMRWGPTTSSLGDVSLQAAPQGYRVILDAGYDTIPEDLQQATVEVVQQMLARNLSDQTLKSETVGDYTWVGRDLFYALPQSVQQVIGLYTSHRA